MKSLFILLTMLALLESRAAFPTMHGMSINRRRAFSNTLNALTARNNRFAQRMAANAKNVKSRNLRVRFDREAQQNRRVNMQKIQNRLLKDIGELSIGRLRDQATNMSRNFQRCFDEEFNKPSEEIAGFSEILDYCTGFAYSIVERVYADIEFKTYELLKDRMIRSIPQRTCEGPKEYQCRTFFRIVKSLMKKEYDVIHSIEASTKVLRRHVNAEDLFTLIEYTDQSLKDYKEARDIMKQEKDFLANYFRDKYEEYMTEHPEIDEVDKDSVRQKELEDEFQRMKAFNAKPEHTYVDKDEIPDYIKDEEEERQKILASNFDSDEEDEPISSPGNQEGPQEEFDDESQPANDFDDDGDSINNPDSQPLNTPDADNDSDTDVDTLPSDGNESL